MADTPSKNSRSSRVDVRRECGFVERLIHELHPALARARGDGERHVPHAQLRVASPFDVAQRPAEPADQEIAQTFFSAGEIVGRVHRAQNVVGGDLPVERGDETMKAVFAHDGVDVGLFQRRDVTSLPSSCSSAAWPDRLGAWCPVRHRSAYANSELPAETATYWRPLTA